MSALELGELLEKLPDVLKVLVDARKPNVCNGIEASKLVQYVLAEPCGRYFGFARVREPTLDVEKKTFERVGRHRALDAGPSQAGKELVTVVRLAAAVVFHDERQRLLDTLVGRVTASAMLAFTPAPRHLTPLREA